MMKISIVYNESLLINPKLFNEAVDILKSRYDSSIILEKTNDNKFEIVFNNKIIYSSDDHFDLDFKIDDKLINKILNYIENAERLNKSKDISAVDDIGIDDF